MSADAGLRDTFVRPLRTPRPSRRWSLGLSGDLPPDLLERTRERLRAVAFLYSTVFFVVGWAPALIFNPAPFAEDPAYWLPGAISIPFGLLVGVLTFRRSIPSAVLGVLGQAFLVASSFGIAFAEYQGITSGIMRGADAGGLGLSWVAPWVVLYNVVVPSTPRREIPVTLAAVAAVPIAYAVGMAAGRNAPVGGFDFFFALVLPNLMVAVMAHAGARVVFGLSTEVKHARELGSYELVERLGQGGMGEVWSARHRMLARPAAIKLIRPEMLGELSFDRRSMILARFEREAQATAAMRCPHTVELYDFGRTEDGSFYYVMELLDGLDAETLVETHGPLPAERVVYLARQVCHSLAEAHDQGLIHRDIKPANVFVCCYGRELDWIKVLDFGLVKAGPELAGDARLTADGSAGGTPAYMAPEQVLGDREVDGRADLYAVGCFLYWLLTGRLVFEGRNAMDTMMKHVQDVPVPPSQRTELAVPQALDEVVLACLAKDPDARPATADDLSVRLGAVPLSQRWTTERARQWWSVHCPPPRRASSAVAGRARPSPGVPRTS